MKKIPLTKNKEAIVDDADYEQLCQYSWFAKRVGKDGVFYAARSKRNNGKVATIYMHREILQCSAGEEADHKNTNKLDNHRQNLEKVTHKENMRRRWNR